MNTIDQISWNSAFWVGVVLTIVFFVIYEVVSEIIRRRVQRKVQRKRMQENDLIRYSNCNIEEGWVGMLDICREITLMDARMFEKLAGLIGSYPLMSPEELKEEFKYSTNLEKALRERAVDRYDVYETLENVVARDSKNITTEKARLEQKWPKATAEYNNSINTMKKTKEENESWKMKNTQDE